MKIFCLSLVLVLVVAINYFEIKRKNKGKLKYAFVNGFIVLFTYIISIMIVIDKPPISPSIIISRIIKFITGE